MKVLGIKAAIKNINRMKKEKQKKISLAVRDSWGFAISEVQESIAGNRGEKRSVDTGNFLNSIGRDSKLKKYTGIVTSNVKYAKYVERKRKHFEKTKNRIEQKIIHNIRKAVAS